MTSSNKILQIYEEICAEGHTRNPCFCGLCIHNLNKRISQKFIVTEEQVKPFYWSLLENQKKIELLKAFCSELTEIKHNDLVLANSLKKEDVFFNQMGVFVRDIIMFIDRLLMDRKLLHDLLGRSLMYSYLIRMENHSGDFGNTARYIGFKYPGRL